MSDEMKMSDVEKNIRASAVMDFVDMIRGAYDSGFIDNHPTNYDIYRSAQMHVKDRYGVETDNWDDELAKESRNDNHDRLVEENKRLRELLKGVVIEFDSQHLDADAYGLMCGINKELGVIDENNPLSQG
ncbi:hypothetical protein [Vibrio cholerae]|uniref:hypothetical protein n=1 Tax=Vibrio cholerae TaxID=666 RepID=UPI0018F0F20D|nr:hypothetical protein [Vibrio cholerae]MBJ6952944.1 hypothetical protein [Vibrio cholerae]